MGYCSERGWGASGKALAALVNSSKGQAYTAVSCLDWSADKVNGVGQLKGSTGGRRARGESGSGKTVLVIAPPAGTEGLLCWLPV